MIIVVTGSRDAGPQHREAVWGALDRVCDDLATAIVVHGGCQGVDALADEWAHRHHIAPRVYLADWLADGAKVGPLRNREMIAGAIDLGRRHQEPVVVLAFPLRGAASRGTMHCAEVARRAGLRVTMEELT